MKIVVTGASGYLGKNVMELLVSQGHEVIAVGHSKAQSQKAPNVRWIKTDLTKGVGALSSISKVDIIVHLAAVVKIKGLTPQDELIAFDGNNQMIINVLSWAAQKGIKKIIYSSSMTVLKEIKGKGKLGLNHPVGPKHMYGLSKLFGEQQLKLISELWGMKCAVVRLPGLYGGERHSGLIYHCAKAFSRSENIALDLKGLGYWDFLHVRDAALMLTKLIESYAFNDPYATFHAGYGDRMTLDDVIATLRNELGTKAAVSIAHKGEYRPCSMDPTLLKRALPDWPFHRKSSLRHWIKEICS